MTNYCCICFELMNGVFNRNVIGICNELHKPVCQSHAHYCLSDGHGYEPIEAKVPSTK